MKNCPICKINLDQAIVAGVEVDYCKKCLGLWFDEDELRQAKDIKDRNLRWLDIDLWLDEDKFKISKGNKLCPTDRLPLYETRYGRSNIKVDVCNVCNGVWLDRGEFKKIVRYLKKKADSEILSHYLKNLRNEFWEIIEGPEEIKEELDDFLMVLKLFQYKLLIQYPSIAKIISSFPK
jgi:Zn-finger nucleic acid-binding protein